MKEDHMFKNSIGIIGGMSPAATVHFEEMLVHNLRARKSQDHPTILCINHGAMPDRTAGLLDSGTSPVSEMLRVAGALRNMGAEILCMPGNSAHAYFDEIQDSVEGAYLMNMIELTANAVARHPLAPKRIGVLAGQGTVFAGLYDAALVERDLHAVYPDRVHQRIVDAVIDGVEADQCDESHDLLMGVIAYMDAHQSCDAFLLGSAELSIIAPARDDLIIIDSLESLAEGVAVLYGKNVSHSISIRAISPEA